MTKSELVSNLKEYDRLSDSWSSRCTGALGVLLLAYVGFTFFFDLPSNRVADIGGWLLIIIFLGGMIYTRMSEKKIDERTSMFCESCKKRFDEDTLAYAVLINECQNCKSTIYET